MCVVTVNTSRNNRRMKTPWNELAKARMKQIGLTQDKLAEALGKTQGRSVIGLMAAANQVLKILQRS